jgi:SAM-dependent methyltransferase
MNSCCTSPPGGNGNNSFFSRCSRSYAKRFRRRGLEKAQEQMLEGATHDSIRAQGVLDIGCGIGALHLTLLKEGAGHSVGVDMSEGMVEQARQLASELGVQEKTSYLVGDFVALADLLPEADITLLDKVVCCYEQLGPLIDKSTGKTKRIYAMSHPRDSLPVKAAFKTQIFLAKIFHWNFHPFWHDWEEMKARIRSKGFQLMYENSTFVWKVLVFKRT